MSTEPRFSPYDLQQFRSALQARESALIDQLAQTKKVAIEELSSSGMGETSHHHTHPADDGAIESNLDQALDKAERLNANLKEVQAALERLSFGLLSSNVEFGVCERCNDSIPMARLLKIPETRFCGACQRENEARQKLQRHHERLSDLEY